MYVIKRGDGLYLTDGAVYTNKALPQPIWQKLDGTRGLYLEESLWNITKRKERLEKIYKEYSISVDRLTDEQLEYLTYRKLRGV